MKNKLAQKASGSQSEETVMQKAFKYFDLNNNGTVEPEEFAKAIEKIGIMIPTRQVGVTFVFELLGALRSLAVVSTFLTCPSGIREFASFETKRGAGKSSYAPLVFFPERILN